MKQHRPSDQRYKVKMALTERQHHAQSKQHSEKELVEITVQTINLLWLLQIRPLIQMKMLYLYDVRSPPFHVSDEHFGSFYAIDKTNKNTYLIFFSYSIAFAVFSDAATPIFVDDEDDDDDGLRWQWCVCVYSGVTICRARLLLLSIAYRLSVSV